MNRHLGRIPTLCRPSAILQIRRPLHSFPPGPVSVHRVRLRRPWFRRAFLTVVACGFGIYGLTEAVIRILNKLDFEALEEEDRRRRELKNAQKTTNTPSLAEDEALTEVEIDDEDDDGEDILSIPLGLPWLVPGRFYSSEDPEIQLFVKLSKDDRLLGELKERILMEVMQDLATDSRTADKLGLPIQITDYWISHVFPHRAPPEYMRLALTLTDDGVKLAVQPISRDRGDRILNHLQPFRVALALRDTLYLYLAIKRAKFKLWRAGFQGDGEQTRVLIPLFFASAPHTERMPQGAKALISEPSSTEPKPEEQRPKTSIPVVIHDESGWSPMIQKQAKPRDMAVAIAYLISRIDQQQRMHRTPPPGIFYIEGMATLRGSRGQSLIHLFSQYDPNERRHKTTVQVRYIVPY